MRGVVSRAAPRTLTLALLAGGAVFALLLWWFGVDGVVAALRQARPLGLAWYATLSALVLLLVAVRWRLVARALGGAPPLARLAAARLAGDAVGALLPLTRLGGDPLRAVLVRDASPSLAAAGAGVAIDRLLELVGNMLAVIAYVAIFALSRAEAAPAPRTLAVAMAGLLLPLVALLVMLARGVRPLAPLHGARARRLLPRLARWFDGLRRVEDHLLTFFAAHRGTFVAGLALAVGTEGVIVAQYHALLGAFGVGLDLPVLLLVLIGGGVARAVPAPAGLGALEAVQVLAVGAATGRADLGFVVALLVRLHETLLLLAGLAALALFGVSLTGLPGAVRAATR